MNKLLRAGFSFILFALSIISILGLLATGHQISIGDFAQVKLILEAIILILTGVMLLKRQSTNIVIIILLVLTQISLTDIYLEIIREDNSMGITILFITITGLTIYHAWGQIKIQIK